MAVKVTHDGEYKYEFDLKYCSEHDYIHAYYWQRTYRKNFYMIFPVTTLKEVQHFYTAHLQLDAIPQTASGDANTFDVLAGPDRDYIGDVIAFPRIKFDPKNIGILSHECTHVAFDTLFGVGGEINPDHSGTNEHFTYLQQEYLEVAMRMMIKGKKLLAEKRKRR